LRADHGDVRLVSVVEDTVQLQMVGACATCHALESTKRELIEPRLRAALPWLRNVVVR
jgi:Fe-S cluster biogenesis protein NfuA